VLSGYTGCLVTEIWHIEPIKNSSKYNSIEYEDLTVSATCRCKKKHVGMQAERTFFFVSTEEIVRKREEKNVVLKLIPSTEDSES
jgi:hypothetical protein